MNDTKREALKTGLLRCLLVAGLNSDIQCEMAGFGVDDLINSIHPVNDETEDADYEARHKIVQSVLDEIRQDYNLEVAG